MPASRNTAALDSESGSSRPRVAAPPPRARRCAATVARSRSTLPVMGRKSCFGTPASRSRAQGRAQTTSGAPLSCSVRRLGRLIQTSPIQLGRRT
ncbi:Uncharacterised protein [Bordetella pertussis]|nr:Uncharacterised protein [Bordetella pertussis]